MNARLPLACIAAFLLVATIPTVRLAHAQPAAHLRHTEALALENRGDERGAFSAFLQAAEDGYAPAQRRLGEIYDRGNTAVERNYSESIRWYERARDGGEHIPPFPPRSYGVMPRSPPIPAGP